MLIQHWRICCVGISNVLWCLKLAALRRYWWSWRHMWSDCPDVWKSEVCVCKHRAVIHLSLSERDNILIMAPKYSLLPYSSFSVSLPRSFFVGQWDIWPILELSCFRAPFQSMELDPFTATLPLPDQSVNIYSGVYGRHCVILKENLMSRQRYSQHKSVKVSFWVDANPSHSPPAISGSGGAVLWPVPFGSGLPGSGQDCHL